MKKAKMKKAKKNMSKMNIQMKKAKKNLLPKKKARKSKAVLNVVLIAYIVHLEHALYMVRVGVA